MRFIFAILFLAGCVEEGNILPMKSGDIVPACAVDATRGDSWVACPGYPTIALPNEKVPVLYALCTKVVADPKYFNPTFHDCEFIDGRTDNVWCVEDCPQ